MELYHQPKSPRLGAVIRGRGLSGSLSLRSRRLASRFEGYSTRAGAGAAFEGEGTTLAATAPAAANPAPVMTCRRPASTIFGQLFIVPLPACSGLTPAQGCFRRPHMAGIYSRADAADTNDCHH